MIMYSKDGVFVQRISKATPRLGFLLYPHMPPLFTMDLIVWECLSSPKIVSTWGVRTETVYSSYIPVVPQSTWQHSRYSIFIEWITYMFFCILSVLSKFHPVRVDLPFWKVKSDSESSWKKEAMLQLNFLMWIGN